MSFQGLLSSVGGPLADMLEAEYRRMITNIPTASGGGNGYLPNANATYARPVRITISSGTASIQPDKDGNDGGSGDDDSSDNDNGNNDDDDNDNDDGSGGDTLEITTSLAAGARMIGSAEEYSRRTTYRVIAAEALTNGVGATISSSTPSSSSSSSSPSSASLGRGGSEEARPVRYTALLLYACRSGSGSSGGGGGGEDEGAADNEEQLVMLSSTPTVPPQTVVNLLAAAASRGVYADCDAAFVPAVQRPDNCGAPPAAATTTPISSYNLPSASSSAPLSN
jgi:hypothetical protein